MGKPSCTHGFRNSFQAFSLLRPWCWSGLSHTLSGHFCVTTEPWQQHLTTLKKAHQQDGWNWKNGKPFYTRRPLEKFRKLSTAWSECNWAQVCGPAASLGLIGSYRWPHLLLTRGAEAWEAPLLTLLLEGNPQRRQTAVRVLTDTAPQWFSLFTKQMELITFSLLETCTEKPKSLNTHVSQINAAVETIHGASKCAFYPLDDETAELLCHAFLE